MSYLDLHCLAFACRYIKWMVTATLKIIPPFAREMTSADRKLLPQYLISFKNGLLIEERICFLLE